MLGALLLESRTNRAFRIEVGNLLRNFTFHASDSSLSQDFGRR